MQALLIVPEDDVPLAAQEPLSMGFTRRFPPLSRLSVELGPPTLSFIAWNIIFD
jgi:hypothetical protein